MERRTFLTGAGAAALAAGVCRGAGRSQGAPEKAKLTLGVGGKPLLYYLPLTIAERKGFFKEQGLDVEINDFGGGAQSLQALDRRLGRRRHRRLRAHHPHAGQGPGHPRRHRARALPGDRRSRSARTRPARSSRRPTSRG